MIKRLHLVIILTIGISANSVAQDSINLTLFETLRKHDSTFFERTFNQCDLDYLQNHIAENLKFYHDQSGYQDREAFFRSMKQNICSGSAVKPIRKVDEESLEVFPLRSNGQLYGAIQNGIHHFYLQQQGEDDQWTSTARFSHIWLLDKGTWKLSEALSYDHQTKPVAKSKSEIEQVLLDNNVPALGLGIIEGGELTKVEVYGTLDKERTAPYNTIFKVASLTKPIVAMTALKLIDKGLLELDEPLSHYWVDPDLKDDKWLEKLTPKIVLTHQTGFPNWRYMNESGRLAFQFEPGTQHQYSGEGFEYLRKAIEIKLNKSIEELAKEHLFAQLDMSDTRFWWDEEMDESRYARNYDVEGNLIPTEKYYEANAAANLLTTVEDYGKFLAHIINGAGLSEGLFEQMIGRQVELGGKNYFGLGWEILTGFSNDEIAVLHTGRDPGVSTLAIWFPKSNNGYLIFLNGDNVDQVYESLLTKRLYLGQELWDMR